MKFRLNKDDDGIILESFLKAVAAHDDYQQIRFMIKDGKIWVNGEKEYARRRLLQPGDAIAFEDRYYIIFPHRDEEGGDRERKGKKEDHEFDPEKKTEKVVHHKGLMKWSEKKIVKKE